MADSIEIRSLRGTSPQVRTEAFNLAFADYVIPFQATTEYLQFRWAQARVDWDLSLGAFDGHRLIGFCWHGIDRVQGETLAYNSGTGVLPTYRGQGLVDRIYEQTWPLLREREVSRCSLEVIAGNDRAQHVYERIGFHSQRELVLMQGELDPEFLESHAAAVEIEELTEPPWAELEAMETVRPAWDFMLSGARTQPDGVRVLAIVDGRRLRAAAVLRDTDLTICWMAVAPEDRARGLASALLRKASERSSKWRMVNVDRRASGLLGLLTSAGMEEMLYQYEMERAVPAGGD